MHELLSRPQPTFVGNPEDLHQFLLYASSPIRNRLREEAKLAWESYKLPRQYATLGDQPIKKGDHMTALTARVIDLRGAHLDGITLGYADLRGVRFDQCSLRGAWLKGAQLEGTSFVDAVLTDAADGRGGARLLGSNL